MNDYLTGLVSALNTETGRRISILRDFEPLAFTIDAAVPCGLIVNELITNSIKHAFPKGGTGEIRVSLKQKEGDAVELIVRDNGAGFLGNLDFTKSSSLGLSLIKSLAKQLAGEADFFNDGGAVARIRFPLPADAV